MGSHTDQKTNFPDSKELELALQYTHTKRGIMDELKNQIKTFIQARDWEQYHAPKNLALALSVEAAEILEIFQWKENDQQLTAGEIEALRQEIGDVLVYLIELADKYKIDIIQAARDKMALNEEKYPVELVKGKAWKYTEYE